MATAVRERATGGLLEPVRTLCVSCDEPILRVVVPAVARHARPALLVLAEPYEWEPRAACQSCAWTRARTGRPADCPRCGGTGYVGERRPPGPLLAVDCAWSDEGHVRLLMPNTTRKAGEALYPLHTCADADQSAIVPLLPGHDERQAA